LSTSPFAFAWARDSQDLRRVAVGVVVAAAHFALIFILQPGERRSADVVEITFFPLPITPEDERDERKLEPAQVSVRRRANDRTRRDTPGARVAPPVSGPTSPTESFESAPQESVVDVPNAPVDWNAQIEAGAAAAQKRADVARQQYSFTSPKAPGSMTPKYVKPPCPFIECEPTWGSGFSVFESQSSKKGRVEKNTTGETIRWINDRCYQYLVTANVFHKAMIKCERPLAKDQARGDLFKHMREVPPPEDKETDVP
jgi:hypothetical protein